LRKLTLFLRSSSWDKTIRVFDLFSKERNSEPLEHLGEVTALAVRNDGE
jgi:WD40 repeat protein